MLEEIRSLVRCFQKDFGKKAEYLIIGQNQFNNLLLQEHLIFQKKPKTSFYLGEIGTLEELKVIIVTSDIIEVV